MNGPRESKYNDAWDSTDEADEKQAAIDDQIEYLADHFGVSFEEAAKIRSEGRP